ncbi:MAG: HAD family phosphatase [Clostridia bacterium]|nr:HAD family phosphatase [Clostridia bacterium]NCC42584.1 HAD family phosphatase [Clostridia bacterium]
MKGAIFDMDGTLLDSMKIWRDLGEIYLIKKGRTPEKGLKEKLWTMTMVEAAAYLKDRYNLSGELDELVAEVYQLIEDFYKNEVEEKPGIRVILEEMAKAGIPMCVASATDSYLVEYALEHVGLRGYFNSIFCCRDVNAGKNSDKIYQAARKSLGTQIEDTWVFEDALHAAKTAKMAGFPLVGICDDSEEDQEEVERIADIYLRDYREWPGVGVLMGSRVAE